MPLLFGRQDPVSPWLLDEHKAFALSMAVLLTVWLIACCIYFLIGFRKPSKNKLVLSKEFTWVWVLVMVTVLPFIAYGEPFELPVARLNPMEAVLEAAPDTPVEETEEEFNAWFLREFEDLEPYPLSANQENIQPPLSPEESAYISTPETSPCTLFAVVQAIVFGYWNTRKNFLVLTNPSRQRNGVFFILG
jgi:hypothetical protein